MKDFINNLRYLRDWIKYMIGPAELVILLLFAILILSGCSYQQPGIKIVKQEVEVPIIIQCIETEDVPKYHEYITVKINKSDNYYLKTKKLIIRDYENQKYAKVVDVLLKKCSQD